jgi:hypothetical protein
MAVVVRGQFQQWIFPVALAISMMTPSLAPLAQGTDNDITIESTIEGDVETQQLPGDDDDAAAVVAAIEQTAATIDEVKKIFSVGNVALVFVPEEKFSSGEIAQAAENHADDIAELRRSIEASAVLYHAIDSRGVVNANIIAVDLLKDNDVRVFVAGEPPE